MSQTENNLNRFKSLFAIDARSLLLFRKGLAIMLVVFLVSCLQNLKIFYSNEGILPYPLHPGKPFWHYLMNLHGINGSVEYQIFLFTVAILLAVLLFFDWAPRLMMFGSWLLLLSLTNRNPLILYGPDIYLRLLLFWGMFLPIPKKNEQTGNMSTAAILLQICMVYFFTAWYKSAAAWWPQGTAVYNALHLKNLVYPAGAWLGALPMPILRTLTYMVFFTEWVVPLLLFIPYKTHAIRMAVVAALIFMHLAFSACLSLGPMSGICITALALFIPKEQWDRVGFFLKEKQLTANRPRPLISSVQKWTGSIFLGACLILALTSNLSHVPNIKDRLPSRMLESAKFIGLDQEWSMFSPQPLTICLWYFVEGRLANGQTVDIARGGKPVDKSEPKNYRDIYPNRTWIPYIKRILSDTNDRSDARHFTDYLAREWNKTHKDAERVLNIRLYKGVRYSAKSPNQGKAYILLEVDKTIPAGLYRGSYRGSVLET